MLLLTKRIRVSSSATDGVKHNPFGFSVNPSCEIAGKDPEILPIHWQCKTAIPCGFPYPCHPLCETVDRSTHEIRIVGISVSETRVEHVANKTDPTDFQRSTSNIRDSKNLRYDDQ